MAKSKTAHYVEKGLFNAALISGLYLIGFLIEGLNTTYFSQGKVKLGLFVFLTSLIWLWHKSNEEQKR